MKTDTKKIIANMLTENTGKHFLDSGGAYGRHWQQNQERNFDKEPEVQLGFSYKSIDYTRSVYHFLINTLDYDEDLTKNLYKFDSEYEDQYANWDTVIEKWLEKNNYHSIYHNNTYNGECNLSQSLLYNLITKEENGSDFYDTDFIILQIHNGCDIRGGYTDPIIFTGDIDYFLMFSDGSIQCENGHNWYTDDTCHWYYDGSTANENFRLDKMEFMDLNDYLDSEDHQEKLEKQIVVSENQSYMLDDYKPRVINPVKYPDYTILVDEYGEGYCPICAMEGKLVKLIA